MEHILTGQDIHRWSVLAFAGIGKYGRMWNCKCACGTIRDVREDLLIADRSKSCGCYAADRSRQLKTKHRMTKTLEYGIWRNMKYRCNNPNSQKYDLYGGRGIKVCKRWSDSFEAFLADIGQRPSKKHSIERKNNALGYTPKNTVWATTIEQNNNRRNNSFITFRHQTKRTTEWSRITGISSNTIRLRLKYGWSIKDTLTRPVQKRNQKLLCEIDPGR